MLHLDVYATQWFLRSKGGWSWNSLFRLQPQMNQDASGTNSVQVSAAEQSRPAEAPVSTGRAATILMIGVVALAFSAILVKTANFEPATSSFLRTTIALVVLVPFAFREIKQKGMMSRNGNVIAFAAGIFLGIDFIAWNYATFLVGAGISSVLLNLQIIVLPLLAMIFDKFKPGRTFWTLVPIMIFGIVLTGGVLEAAAPAEVSTAYGLPINLLGTIFGSTSGLCYGIYLYTSRKSGTLNPGRYVQPMVLVCIAQALVATIFMLFSERGFDVTHGVLNADGSLPPNPIRDYGAPIDGMSWVWMIILAVTAQAMAWLFVQYGSVHMDPTMTAGLLLLSPIATVFISPFILGENPSALQFLGVVIVLGAVSVQNGLHKALLQKLRKAPV